MNKLFTKIAGLSVGLAMAIGVGVAVGSKDVRSVSAVDYNAPTNYNLASNVPSGLTASTTLTRDSSGRGMGKAGYTYTLTTSTSFTDVGKIVVNAATNYGTYSSHSVSATVGGSAFGSAQSFTAKASTNYTIEASKASGVVVVSLNNGKEGTTKTNTIWCLSIDVYTVAAPAQTYTVSFAVNTAGYGTVSQSSITGVPSGTSISTSNNTVTINGTTVTATPTANTAQYTYAFTGWSNNTGTVTAARTITANFSRTINTFTVDGSGITNGTLAPTSNVSYGAEYSGTITPATDYTYPDSLTVSMGGNTLVADSDYLYDNTEGTLIIGSVTGNLVISGACLPEGTAYTVTYNANSGTVSPASESVVENGHPSFPTPTRSGYNFKGWQVNGSGTAYIDPEDYTVTGDVTFVASWAAVYTVTFNANGGSSTPASESIESGSTFIFPSAGTKTHYTFNGWKSPSDANLYAVGATSPAVTAAITYTAQWVPDAQYDVTYTANSGGSGSFVDEDQWSGSYTLKPFADLTGVSAASGYQFKNYTVGGVNKNPGDTITLSAATAVTVNFEEKPSEVTVSASVATYADDNSWVNSTKYSSMTLDSNVTASVAGGANSGKYYEGDESWRIYSSETGTLTISVSGEGNSLSSITLTFPSTDSPSITYGGNSVTSETPVSVSGTSAVFTVGGGKAHITDISVTYIAASAPTPTYTITYSANAVDATGSTPSTTGTAPEVASCGFEREGYTFERWNTQADGEGDDYAVGATVSENLNLYAIWQESIAPIGGNVTMAGVTSCQSATINGHSGLKCGAGSTAGEMTLTLTQANITKIKVYIAGWGTDTGRTINVSISAGTISVSSITITGDTGISGSSTSFTLDGEETDYKFEFTITNAPADTVITLTAAQASKNRFVVWGATDLFAETFASEFMSKMTCNNGASMPSFAEGYSWTQFEAIYNGLDDEEKGRLHDALANEGGSQIEQSMARYDYIEGKYNPSDIQSSPWKNFIGRTVTPLANSRILIATAVKSTGTVIAIVIISAVSLVAIGGYFLFRKKKEQ